MPKKKSRAVKTGLNKSEAIRQYLSANPGAVPSAIVAALKAKGIDVSTGLVGLVKYKGRKKAGRKPSRPTARRPTKSGVNRSEAVRKYLASHPTASPTDVQAALAARGIIISASLASAIKYRKPGKKARATTKRGPGRPRKVAVATNGTLTADTLIEAKRFSEKIGGTERAKRLLELLEQLA